MTSLLHFQPIKTQRTDMRMQKGWFVSSREIAEAFYRPDQSMCSYGAWHWLLSEAAFKDHSTNYKGRIIQIKRGQVPTSLEKLANTFKWSINRVRRWLKNGALSGNMVVSTDMGFTIITICKYDEIQTGKFGTDTDMDSSTASKKNNNKNRKADKKKANNRTNENNESNKSSGGSACDVLHTSPPLAQNMPQWHFLLLKSLGEDVYKSWLRLLLYDSGYITCSKKFILDWCKKNYENDIELALKQCGLKFLGFRFANQTKSSRGA